MGTIGPFSVRCLKILDEDTTAAPSPISSTISLTSSAVPSPQTGGLFACIHLFQLRLLPWNMFHSLQCTMVNPFVAGSLVLLTFIDIMETISEKAFKRAFKSNGCYIFSPWASWKISFLTSHSKKLEASSFNHRSFTAWWSCIFAWARMLVISIKQIDAIPFLFSFKKVASKIDKHVMLSYLLLCNKRPEFDFCLTPSKIPTCTSQANSLKIGSIWILPQRKT